MSGLTPLKASARPRAGKGAARQARREGHVPAVIYGDSQTPEMIAIEYNTLWKQLLKGHFTSTAFELDVDGKKHIVLARDVQLDPVRDTPLHVDFQRVGKDTIIHVKVPLHFVNADIAPGVKMGHGIINHVMNELDVQCLPDALPEFIEVDVGHLELGHSIHLADLKLPKGVESVQFKRGGNAVVATIQVPGAAVEAEPSAAPAASQVPATAQKDKDAKK